MWNTVVVYDPAVHIIHVLDILHGQHLVGGTDGEDPSLAHEDNIIRVLGRDIEIVADHNHQEALLAGELLQEMRYAELMLDIEIGCRLVEQNRPWLLDKAPGQHHALFLTGAQLIETAHRKILDLEPLQRVVDNPEVGLGCPPTRMRVPPQQYSINDRHRERLR